MKPLRLVFTLVLSLLAWSSYAQSDGIADRVMRRDTGLVLIKRQQATKYIVGAAVDKRKQVLYMLDRQGNAWDSLKVSPADYKEIARGQTDPFGYYIGKQRLGIVYQNELIRQFRERGKLDSLSPLYLSAIANFPQFKHTDSTTLIKAILTLERQNRRDSIYAWGGNIGDPRYFPDAETYAHGDGRQPGERFTSGDTLFFINSEPLSKVHLAILVKSQSRISYFNREGRCITRFTLGPGEISNLPKTDVFGNYLSLLEQGKLMLDKQVVQLSKYKGPFVRYTGLNQQNDKALTDAIGRQRSLDEKLDYALSPDLKALATTLKEGYTNTPVNRPWLSFLGIEDYTTPPSWDSVGTRRYELTNHLGNVLVTITDKRLTDGSYYLPDISTAQDYYAFGALMPARTFKADSNYRYGFNGKENDNAVKGVGNQQDYGKRIYDNRVGRFLSVDPLQIKYPELTPYQFASNSPIANVDLDGREKYYYTLTFNENTGDATLKLNKVVNQETFLFWTYTPHKEFDVDYPQGSFGNRSFTFTEHGWSTHGNTIADFETWFNNPSAYRNAKSSTAPNSIMDPGQLFYSDAASGLADYNVGLRAFADYGGAGMLNNRSTVPMVEGEEVSSIHDGNPSAGNSDTHLADETNIQQRAQEIHSVLSQRTQNSTTTAVATAINEEGKQVTLVAFSETTLRRSQREVLKPGEIAVSGNGHAEQTLINYANAHNLKITAIAASRPICSNCAIVIQNAGAKPASPLKRTGSGSRPRKNPASTTSN